jgi:cation diffusion facilitator family transporter
MDHPAQNSSRTGGNAGDPRLFMGSAVVINALLCIAAFVVYFSVRSQLVLAQGSDSLLDVASGLILFITAWVGSQPRDENHPYGHDRAEPLGALITAVLAGVLAFEVLRSAVGALIVGEDVQLDVYVAAVLGGKFVLKVLLLATLRRRRNKASGAAVGALLVDTRNDLVACASSLVGFGMARAGLGWADAALALPVAIYIGASGIELARENIRLLMGEAPAPEIVAELRSDAKSVPGVIGVGRLRAQHAGPNLYVEVEILVAEYESATGGHDIAVAVQDRLEEHEMVAQTFVHIDTQSGVEHP